MTRLIVLIALALVVGCNPDADAEGPAPAPEVAEFGFEDERAFDRIATGDDDLDVPRDLEFHPDRPDELWVINRATDGIVVLFDAGTEEQVAEERRDSFGNHFMEEASSLAFGVDDTFASCQESRNTYDGQGQPNDFMGPALWSSDLDIFAEVNQDNSLLGSHLDMLHESPLCMGIAHDSNNAYWVFDGYNGHVVYYDFQEDHGPGYDDHSDGVVRRYVEAELTYEEDVPGHLILDQDTGWLYVADTGAGRVIRVDTDSGDVADALREEMENLDEYSEMAGVEVEVFAEGLDLPSGIAIHEGRLFVSDYGQNEIIAYSLDDGSELGRVDATTDGIMGITVGPDGKLYFVDGEEDAVIRLDPSPG